MQLNEIGTEENSNNGHRLKGNMKQKQSKVGRVAGWHGTENDRKGNGGKGGNEREDEGKDVCMKKEGMQRRVRRYVSLYG